MSQEYICKYCGQREKNAHALSGVSCMRSPSKRHYPIPFLGSRTCVYCGSNVGKVGGSCARSPHGHHELIN